MKLEKIGVIVLFPITGALHVLEADTGLTMPISRSDFYEAEWATNFWTQALQDNPDCYFGGISGHHGGPALDLLPVSLSAVASMLTQLALLRRLRADLQATAAEEPY